MSDGLVGDTGSLTGQDLLEALRTLRCSGTLALTGGTGSVLLQLARGQVEATFKLGSYDALDRPMQSFHLYRHEPADVPRLPGRVSKSLSPVLRSLPRLAAPVRLPAGLVDLRALLDRLAEQAFNGSLSLVDGDDALAVLFLQGRVGAAVYERAGVVHERADAMRALQRAGMGSGNPALELDALDPMVVRSLLGMAQGRRHASTTDLDQFDGLVLDAGGARFMRNGQAYLQVDAEGWPTTARFAPLNDDATPTELALPDEPPGWEEQRYALTLRGQDALNPMTELSMAFHDDYGRTGQQVLATLGRGHSLQQVADSLKLELQDLKQWLQRLEGDGMVRSDAA